MSLRAPWIFATQPDFFKSYDHGKMILIALLSLELARERLSEVSKHLKAKKELQP